MSNKLQHVFLNVTLNININMNVNTNVNGIYRYADLCIFLYSFHTVTYIP